jgi:hypothetical protein
MVHLRPFYKAFSIRQAIALFTRSLLTVIGSGAPSPTAPGRKLYREKGLPLSTPQNETVKARAAMNSK